MGHLLSYTFLCKIDFVWNLFYTTTFMKNNFYVGLILCTWFHDRQLFYVGHLLWHITYVGLILHEIDLRGTAIMWVILWKIYFVLNLIWNWFCECLQCHIAFMWDIFYSKFMYDCFYVELILWGKSFIWNIELSYWPEVLIWQPQVDHRKHSIIDIYISTLKFIKKS